MRRLWQVLFWSMIPAAFVGPGTVTTAASAGARFGHALLWALLFSTAATFVLQEASARLCIVSGQPLAAALHRQFRQQRAWFAVALLVVGAIVAGCAAFQVGNIVGAAAGLRLLLPQSGHWPTWGVGVPAGLLLLFGSTRTVARVLGLVVAIMGLTFLLTALLLAPSVGSLLRGALWPQLPAGADLLVLGLVGTTVVPYNLFLGSRLALGQETSAMRFGLGISVALGGLISMGILVVGTAVSGDFSFDGLAATLAQKLGGWAAGLFALGLYAAGLSSAITAPLAAAITARGLFGREDAARWHERSWRYRSIWILVLVTGMAFGLAGVRPVPAIIAAQAANGILLPLLAIFLIVAVNDRALMGGNVNGARSNLCMILATVVCFLLGSVRTLQALASVVGVEPPSQQQLVAVAVGALLITSVPVTKLALARRRRQPAPHRA